MISDRIARSRAITVWCQLIHFGIGSPFGHPPAVEFGIARQSDFMSGDRRDFIGFHRANDFRRDENQQFGFIVRGSFGVEEQGPDERYFTQ